MNRWRTAVASSGRAKQALSLLQNDGVRQVSVITARGQAGAKVDESFDVVIAHLARSRAEWTEMTIDDRIFHIPKLVRGATEQPGQDTVRLYFDDDTFIEAPIPELPPALDVGPALLEPITVDEYHDIEAALALLWRAVHEGELEEYHQVQLRCLVELLAEEHRDTVPEVTERHKLVGTTRAVARFAAKPEITGAFAWWKIGELLLGTNWPNVARYFLDTAAKVGG